MKNNKLTIDLIIPAFNAEPTIERCLESVLKLKTVNETINIIVVNNNSKDRTSELARRYPVQVLECKNQGRSAARNFGVQHSSGDYIGFVDCDVILHTDWIQEMLSLFTSPAIGAAQGPIVPHPEGNFVDRFLHDRKNHLTNGTYVEMEGTDSNLPMIDTAACLYRREAVVSVGGLDEDLIFQEDRDLSHRVVAKGYSLRITHKAETLKISRRNPWQFVIRTFADSYCLAYYTEPRYNQNLIPHIVYRLGHTLPYLPQTKNPVYFCYDLFLNLLYQSCYAFYYTYFRLKTGKKITLELPVQKKNLLFGVIQSEEKKGFIISPLRRFYLSETKLIVYGTPGLPRKIEDQETIMWFNDFLSKKISMAPKSVLEILIDAGLLTEMN